MTGDKIHPNDKGYIFLADIIARSIAPEADIPDLPDDLFIQISGYDKGDSGVFMESSLAGLNIAPLWDNDAKRFWKQIFPVKQSVGSR